jgi:transposase
MARRKSFLPRLTIDNALKSHNCQHNKAHRIQQGDKRLKVAVERSFEHFCVTCALESISGDIEVLKRLADELQ